GPESLTCRPPHYDARHLTEASTHTPSVGAPKAPQPRDFRWHLRSPEDSENRIGKRKTPAPGRLEGRIRGAPARRLRTGLLASLRGCGGFRWARSLLPKPAT